MTLTVTSFRGLSAMPHLPALAALRIGVFREYPYLYDGDPDYERRYLATYAGKPSSLIVLAREGEAVIGAATAIALGEETDEVQAPFRDAGLAIDEFCYFGESVLLPEWRGRGLGHAFFDAREAHARALGKSRCAFCAVRRDEDDPRRPPGVRDLGAFWRKRGYAPMAGLHCRMRWRELGDDEESEHRLDFWSRTLPEAPT